MTPSTSTEITQDTTYTYTYASKDRIIAKVTFKVVNGAWNDGTTEDKTVTLTGYEGDTLKLVADQIPAIGSKPSDNYKEGSWNITPSTSEAIAQDVTYTYALSYESNAANEVLVAAFLNQQIRFFEIQELLEEILETHLPLQELSLEAILETDKRVRQKTRELIESREHK